MRRRSLLVIWAGVVAVACSRDDAPAQRPPAGGCEVSACAPGTCGAWPDGCGGSRECGSCPGGEACGAITPGYCSACSQDGWCAEDPLPAEAGHFSHVFARAADDVWFSGDGGLVWEWDGRAWRDRSSQVLAGGLRAGPAALWGAAPDAMWGVSFRGMWAWEGTRWTLTTKPGWALNDVSGTAADDVWAVGDAGLVLHHDGAGWAPVATPVAHDLLSVHARSAGEVYVAGEGGTLMRWNGLAWDDLRAPDGMTTFIRVHASAPDDVWVLDTEWSAFRLEDGVLAQKYGSTTSMLTDVWTFGPEDVWLAGTSGLAVHLDASGWHETATGTSADLLDLAGTAGGELWIATGSPLEPALHRPAAR